MLIRNVSPFGDLEVPLLHPDMLFAAGEERPVTEDQARRLLPQTENYEPADAEARALADEVTAVEAEHAVELARDEGMPALNASKDAWRSWVKSRGGDIEGKDRAQLIAEYGPDAVAAAHAGETGQSRDDDNGDGGS